MEEALAGAGRVYGVTTGMGYLAGVDLGDEEAARHQRRLLLGRAVGSAPYLPPGEARAVMVARLAGFLSGHAGVTAALCAFLADRLNDGFVPAIPRRGAGGAGEVMPLAHAFQTLVGVGWVLEPDGSLREAAAALASRGAAPYEPEAKEGIALLAGAPGTVGLAMARRRTVRTLADQHLTAAACAMDALRAPLDPLDPALAGLRDDPLHAAVLGRLAELLAGSPERPPAVRQAPVSYRVVPQVQTHLDRALVRFEEDLRRALAATGDSPALVAGRFISSGAFHEVELAAGMDALAAALARAGELGAQRLHRLLDGRFSGLPDQLTPMPGPRCGLVVVQKRAVGALNELRRLAAPASVGALDTALGQEDAMTFAFEAAEKLRRAEELVRELLACELLAARQAWFLRGAPPPPGLAAAAAPLLAGVEPVEDDRPLGPDLDCLVTLLDDGWPDRV
jgi:histidine ammonia-lyase